MLLDHDPDVVGLSSQTFTLTWRPGGRRVSHTPDYFARLSDGSALIVDVRPVARVKPSDTAKFAATAAACEVLGGWSFRLVHEVDPVLAGNLRWLAGFRHPRYRCPTLAPHLGKVFGGGEGCWPGCRR